MRIAGAHTRGRQRWTVRCSPFAGPVLVVLKPVFSDPSHPILNRKAQGARNHCLRPPARSLGKPTLLAAASGSQSQSRDSFWTSDSGGAFGGDRMAHSRERSGRGAQPGLRRLDQRSVDATASDQAAKDKAGLGAQPSTLNQTPEQWRRANPNTARCRSGLGAPGILPCRKDA